MTKRIARQIADCQEIDCAVIMDNCSTDASYHMLKQDFLNTGVEVLLTERNGGYAYGNNCGIRYLMKQYAIDYVFVINPDVILQENCIKEMLLQMESHNNIGVLGAVRTDKNGQFTQGQYWKIPDFRFELLDSFGFLRYNRRTQPKTIQSEDNVFQVEVVPGCFYCARVEALKKVGYLDEHTFLFYEENILAIRMQNAGYDEGIATNASIIHDHQKRKANTLRQAQFALHQVIESKKYFCREYLNLSVMKSFVLSIARTWSKAENATWYLIKKVRNGVHR